MTTTGYLRRKCINLIQYRKLVMYAGVPLNVNALTSYVIRYQTYYMPERTEREPKHFVHKVEL